MESMLMSAIRPSDPPSGDVANHAADVELARRATSGDEDARRVVASRLLDKVRNTASYLAGGNPDADDYAQMALIEILGALPSFRGGSSLESWAGRIAARTIMRQLRRMRWRRGFWDHGAEPEPVFENTAEMDAANRAVSKRLATLLGKLSPKQRNAVVLQSLLGYSLEEVCEMTKSNPNTVKYRLRVGRARLRELIAKDSILSEHLGGAQ